MFRITRATGVLFVVLMLALAALPATPARAQQGRLCFAEVPDCIEGRFAEYWQQNGGLPVFGFPIGPARTESVGGGQFLVQPFERNRFELHPENARPYDVLLGRLGVDRLVQLGRPWEGQPKAPTGGKAGCQYFGETQHLVCDQILAYWSSNGLNLDGKKGFTAAESLALFGLPITEAAVENGSDGKPYLTQWFERARFEVHPEVGPNAVLLGLLGREVGAAPAPAPEPQPAPPAADPCASVPDPVNARIRPGKCFPVGTVGAIDVFGFKPNEQVGFWINKPDGSIFGTVQTIPIGPSGAINDIPLETSLLEPGMWSFVVEGASSGNKAIAYFYLTPAAPPSGDASVPASISADVKPAVGPAGTRFHAIGVGFKPGERVGVYVTVPDGSVFGAPWQVGADENGVTDEVDYQTKAGFPTGVWAMTFEGVSSGHKAIAYFRVQ